MKRKKKRKKKRENTFSFPGVRRKRCYMKRHRLIRILTQNLICLLH